MNNLFIKINNLDEVSLCKWESDDVCSICLCKFNNNQIENRYDLKEESNIKS